MIVAVITIVVGTNVVVVEVVSSDVAVLVVINIITVIMTTTLFIHTSVHCKTHAAEIALNRITWKVIKICPAHIHVVFERV